MTEMIEVTHIYFVIMIIGVFIRDLVAAVINIVWAHSLIVTAQSQQFSVNRLRYALALSACSESLVFDVDVRLT